MASYTTKSRTREFSHVYFSRRLSDMNNWDMNLSIILVEESWIFEIIYNIWTWGRVMAQGGTVSILQINVWPWWFYLDGCLLKQGKAKVIIYQMISLLPIRLQKRPFICSCYYAASQVFKSIQIWNIDWLTFIISHTSCIRFYFFLAALIVKVWGKKQDTIKNWPLIEIPHFLSNHYETWSSFHNQFFKVSWGLAKRFGSVINGQFLIMSWFFLRLNVYKRVLSPALAQASFGLYKIAHIMVFSFKLSIFSLNQSLCVPN